MRVIHLSLTTVAGAPLKVVEALRRHKGIHAKAINLNWVTYGLRSFPEDLRWPDDKEEIYAEIYAADIIHLHQCVALVEPTLGLDFTNKTLFGKTHFIREWHSEPSFFARLGLPSVESFANEPLPWLTMAQYHERYYPQAIPVPLLTNVEELSANPLPLPFPPVVAFSPSSRLPLKEWRWSSKGYDETLAALESLQKECDFTLDIIEDVPWVEAIERKKRATIIIDDMVTGSFHTSGLEGLAMGKPTFAYLDARTVATLATLTKSNALPFLNCSINHFPTLFKRIISDEALCNSIGNYSRTWMQKYYHEKKLISHYVNIYKKLMRGTLKKKQVSDNVFLAIELQDRIFQSIHNFEEMPY